MIETWESDSLSLRVTVTDEVTGAPLDLSAASVEALAEGASGLTVEGVCTIVDPAGGQLRADFAARSISEGAWVLQVRVTIATEVQTIVSEKLRSRHSVEAAA